MNLKEMIYQNQKKNPWILHLARKKSNQNNENDYSDRKNKPVKFNKNKFNKNNNF